MRTDMAEIHRSGGFWPHWRAGQLLHVGFAMQSCVLTGICVAGALAASARDHTLLMSGRNVGLLQHPTIWAFSMSRSIVVKVCFCFFLPCVVAFAVV